MSRATILLLVLAWCLSAKAQPNCEAYKYLGDTLKYQACLASQGRLGFYQFSYPYQQALDKALAIDPSYDYAYRAKSTAYLKSGDFLTWKQLIDKAVEYNLEEHLGYRGWCRYQFFRDYTGAIRDIELLDSLVDYDIGYSANGNYHLHVARALCYKAIGQPARAISIIKVLLKSPGYMPNMYDYLHLGVLYLEAGNLTHARAALESQLGLNDLAEARYYLARVAQQEGDTAAARAQLEQALQRYEERKYLFDDYSHPPDRIFREDIMSALDEVNEHQK